MQTAREADTISVLYRFAGVLYQLDSRLRGNDAVFAHGVIWDHACGNGKKKAPEPKGEVRGKKSYLMVKTPAQGGETGDGLSPSR